MAALAWPRQPKAPVVVCPGQKSPPGSLSKAVPVVMGVRFTGNAGSTVAEGGSQSCVLPAALTGVHGAPASGDAPEPDVQVASQVPELVTPGVPPTHSGHGELAFAVRYTVEVSGKLPVNVPSVRSSVPLAGDAKVLRTHVDVPALAIGKYGPNAQPVFEQMLLLPACAEVRALMTHVEPVQVAFICVSALSGVGPSATVESPAPTFKPPQPSVLRTVPAAPPDRTAPHPPSGAPVTNLSSIVVLVVVLVLVLVVLVSEVLVVVVWLVLVVLMSVELVDVVVGTTLHDATTPCSRKSLRPAPPSITS